MWNITDFSVERVLCLDHKYIHWASHTDTNSNRNVYSNSIEKRTHIEHTPKIFLAIHGGPYYCKRGIYCRVLYRGFTRSFCPPQFSSSPLCSSLRICMHTNIFGIWLSLKTYRKCEQYKYIYKCIHILFICTFGVLILIKMKIEFGVYDSAAFVCLPMLNCPTHCGPSRVMMNRALRTAINIRAVWRSFIRYNFFWLFFYLFSQILYHLLYAVSIALPANLHIHTYTIGSPHIYNRMEYSSALLWMYHFIYLSIYLSIGAYTVYVFIYIYISICIKSYIY